MKTTNAFYKSLLILLLGVCTTGFQNWNYIDIEQVSIGPVNEQARITHARELLGKGFKGSFAQVGHIQDLNQYILHKVTRRFPKAFKDRAVKFTQVLVEETQKNNLDPLFVLAIIQTESNYNPKAIGPFGEIGLMQLKPDTAAWIAGKSDIPYKGHKTLEDPITNLRLGVAYMTYLRDTFDGLASSYLSAYNMGPNRTRRMVANKKQPRVYALKVMGHYKDLYLNLAQTRKQVAKLDL